MQPRLPTSKKWTAFPKEYTEQIQGVFRENFASPLANGQLIIEGRIYPREIILRVGYLEPGRLKQANFEVSMDYSAEEKEILERIHNCVDAAASMMADYFENDGEVDFPPSWSPFPFNKKTVYLRFSTENSELEAAADRLLGLNEEGLLQGADADEGEDALERAEIDEDISGGKSLDDALHVKSQPTADEDAEQEEDDGDRDDDGQPRMFGGKKRKLH